MVSGSTGNTGLQTVATVQMPPLWELLHVRSLSCSGDVSFGIFFSLRRILVDYSESANVHILFTFCKMG